MKEPENPNKKLEKESLNALIEIQNIYEDEKYEYVISNAFLQDISCYSKEEEVLIFPFTGFEVTGWEKSSFENKVGDITEGTIFYFKFSKKYFKKIKANYEQ